MMQKSRDSNAANDAALFSLDMLLAAIHLVADQHTSEYICMP